jgi:hypothetical protein
MEIKDYSSNQYFTKYSKVNSTQTIAVLNDQSTLYSITKLDIFNKLKESSIFSFDDRYLANVFYSIIPDTRAIGVSIVEEP